jgi:hypothetical protein
MALILDKLIIRIRKMNLATGWRFLLIGKAISPSTVFMVAELQAKFKIKGNSRCIEIRFVFP